MHPPDQHTLPPDALTVEIKHNRYRDDGDLHEAQQRSRPMRAQRRIQGRSSQGERTADDGADDGVAGQGAGGIDAVATGDVVGRVDKNGRVAGPKGDASEDGPDPVHRGNTRPCEPELADGHQAGCHTHYGDRRFGNHFSCLRIVFVRVDHPADEGFTEYDSQRSYPDPAECESGNPDGPAPDLAEDDGVGDEAEVEDAVNDGDVEIPEDADGFGDGHDEGTGEVDLEKFEKGDVLIVTAPPAGIPRSLAAAGGLAFEDGGRIGFFDDADENPGDAGDDHDDPVGPAPAKVLRRKTTDDRAKLGEEINPYSLPLQNEHHLRLARSRDQWTK